MHFADHDILTPGDAPNVLVAMNPAALKANIADVPRGAEIIVNTDEFTKRAMQKVGYGASPLEDGSLDGYQVHPVPLTTLTVQALKEFELSRKDAGRSKNMFALGLLSWMYHRPTEGTERFLRSKFAKRPQIAEANIAAFRAGWNFGETTEDFAVSYEVAPAASAFPTGTYRNISGNLALSYGLIAASRQADLPLYLGSYPITCGFGHSARVVEAQEFRCAHVPGGGRDRGDRRGAGCGVRRLPGGHDDVGSRCGAEVGDDRPGGLSRTAVAGGGHPAGWPLDGSADEDGAGGPAAGDVRA